MNSSMRVVSWNCRKASPKSPLWDYLLELAPDIALLQEVSGLSPEVGDRFACLQQAPVRKSGAPQAFKNVVLVHGAIGPRLALRSPFVWVEAELQRFAGNVRAVTVQPDRGPLLNLVGVYSPAWPVDKRRLLEVNVSPVRLTQNRDVWVGDLLWSALGATMPTLSGPWLIAGDFNLCETFDAWRSGPRGNREYLDRMQQLGLVDCLRHAQGRLTPTFRTLRTGNVTAQIDYVFASADLLSGLVACETGSRERVFEPGLGDLLPVLADFVM